MSFDAGAVVGRLVLDTSGFTASAVRASNQVEQLGAKIVSTTRQLSRAASSMTFLGAAITAPLIAAFKSAEKYSNPVHQEIKKLNDTFLGLRVSIAESLLPVVHQFGNAVADLTQRWKSLSPELRDSMFRTAALTGVFLTLGGTISIIILKIAALIGYVIKLAGAFAAFAMLNPELLLIRVAIVGIALAMLKWKEVGDIVMNTLQILFDIAKVGFNAMLGLVDSITSAFFAAATGALKFLSAITINREAKTQLNELAKGAWDLAQAYSELANKAYKNVADAGVNAYQVLNTGQSEFAQGFDNLKNQTQTWIDLFKNLGSQEISIPHVNEASQTFAQGWSDALENTKKELANWGQMATDTFQGMTQTLTTGFSNLGMSIIGMGDDIQTVFANLGKSIIQMFMDILAKWIAMKVMMGIGNAVSSVFSWGAGAATSAGTSSISASSISGTGMLGHADGIESTPYDGLYKLHEGEKVVPKYDASKAGGGGIELTIVNQITPEAVATAMSGKEGAGVIVNTIDANALRNGSTRRTIRSK